MRCATTCTDAEGTGITCWQVPHWREVPGLQHGFLGRQGGSSRPPFDSLNLSCAVGDDPASVAENWARVHAVLDGMQIALPAQEHGANVTVVPGQEAELSLADGLVTCSEGLALGVLTADCVPILLLAPRVRAIGILHAGWRGTAARIAERGVTAMQRAFDVKPAEIEVALGPAIGGCCYWVGPDVIARLVAAIRGAALMPVRSAGFGPVDLRAWNRIQFIECGLPPAQIHVIGPCTSCAAEDFFSFRAAGGRTGRQLSFIGWAGE